MKAAIYKRYGDAQTLQLANVAKPVPKENEILIKVYATDVSAADCRFRKADPWAVRLINGLFRPKKIQILGGDVAGVVEAAGSSVREYRTGDAVFASCGLQFGGYAEYVALPENSLISRKPDSMTFIESATVPSNSVTALRFLNSAEIKSGQKVMIYGASGSVGTFAVQIARILGAEVTGVCSAGNRELVKSLGACEALDYARQDFSLFSGRFDIVFDAVGRAKKSACKRMLKPEGKFVTVKSLRNRGTGELRDIKEFIGQGKLRTVIDREYALEQIVKAHAYVDQGHKRGNVAVRVLNEPAGW
ncbi:MAG: NAD(P)-dependent alcohol dehydrogenase [Bacteroidales bacterium]|jgi:NADPH:quinone reductase-like Zn-dependent oxidoreductase|nr:NAD(P)-dependent alcohol dehydrogenase [Bacteroidales bacterium]